jgi:glycolate oxidase FAD binding subunit
VLPLPAAERTLQLEMDQSQAIRAMNEWAGRSLPISATCHRGNTLSIRLSGADAGLQAAALRIGGEELADASSFWRDLREQRCEFFRGEAPLWRLAVKSTAPGLPLAGAQLLEWNGGLRWIRTDADAALVREVAHKAGGHATLFRAMDHSIPAFHPLPAPLMRLHQRLKQTFDPAGVLNPGRLYPEL